MPPIKVKAQKRKETDYFLSEQFKEDFQKRVEEDTWNKGLPKIYIDDNGDMVKHWKDGTIEKINGNEED